MLHLFSAQARRLWSSWIPLSHTHTYVLHQQVLLALPPKSFQNLPSVHTVVHLSPPTWTIVAAFMVSLILPPVCPQRQSQGPITSPPTHIQETDGLATSRVTSAISASLLSHCSSEHLWTKALCQLPSSPQPTMVPQGNILFLLLLPGEASNYVCVVGCQVEYCERGGLDGI